MARRLMKALECLTAQYDGSVRNPEGRVQHRAVHLLSLTPPH